MTIIQIDVLHPQPLQALLARLFAVLWGGINYSLHLLALANDPGGKFGGQEDFIALSSAREPFPNEILRVLVDICRIPDYGVL